MKVAAYQAPLLASGSVEEALGLIREQVDRCEVAGVEILCCPEGILGGLADYAAQPVTFAIDAEGGSLDRVLAPLASETVTTIVGFTEIDAQRRLFNSAAVFHRGSVIGLYRKLYPAINRSVYEAGDRMPVFTVGELTFGIVFCGSAARFGAVGASPTVFRAAVETLRSAPETLRSALETFRSAPACLRSAPERFRNAPEAFWNAPEHARSAPKRFGSALKRLRSAQKWLWSAP